MPEPVSAGSGLTQDAFLGGKLMLLQPERGYRAGLDAVLLAATVTNSRTDCRLADLGAGVGTVGLSAATRLECLRAVLIEREPDLVALARDNITHNDLAARVEVIAADLEAESAADLEMRGLKSEHFDYVVANPPFQVEGDGRTPPDRLKARSHVMRAGGVERWARVMARLAKPDGTATMIHRADALAEMLAAFGGRFGAIAVLPVYPRAGLAAHRVIVTGIKGSRAPLRMLPGLVVHGDDGHGFTPTLEAVLRRGAGLDLTGERYPILVPATGTA